MNNKSLKYCCIVLAMLFTSINTYGLKLCSLDSALQLLKKDGIDSFYKWGISIEDLPLLDNTIINQIVDIEWRNGMYRPSFKINNKIESWIPRETIYMVEEFESKYAYDKLLSCYTSIPKQSSSDTDYYYSVRSLPALVSANNDSLWYLIRHDYPIWHDLLKQKNIPISNKFFTIDHKNICIQFAATLCYLNEPGFDSTSLALEYGIDFSSSYLHIKRATDYSRRKSTIIRYDPTDINSPFVFKEIPSKRAYVSVLEYLQSKSDEEVFNDITFSSMKYGNCDIDSPVLYHKNVAIIHYSCRGSGGSVMIKIINGKVYIRGLMFYDI